MINSFYLLPARFTWTGVVRALWLTLFSLMLFVPTTYRHLKGVILVLLISAVIFGVRSGEIRLQLHEAVLKWLLAVVLIGIFFVILGVLNANPGALRVVTVYILWPLVFSLVIPAIDKKGIDAVLNTLAITSLAIGLYGFIYLFHAKGWWPSILYLPLDQGQAVGFYEGVVEYNMYSIATLIAVIPMLAVALVEQGNDARFVHRIILWLAYAFCIGLAILSGRRGLWLSLAMSPFIYLLLQSALLIRWHQLRPRLFAMGQLLAVSAVMYLACAAVFNLSGEKILAYARAAVPLASAPNASAPDASAPDASAPDASAPDASASLRYLQAVALWKGWLERPWLGHGHGAVASIIRSETMPWAYELTYLALLFHTGIVGALSYAACVVWIYWQGVRVARRSSAYRAPMLATLTGLGALIIANATNPYLAKFDFMWVIFLPVAIINRYLIERQSTEVAA